MFDTQRTLDLLAAEIATALPELAVELYPDAPEGYRLTHPQGAVLLSFLGAPSDPPRLLGPAAEQDIIFRFGLTLVSRRLWGEQGAIPALDRLREALLGWRPPQCDPLYHVNEALVGQDAQLWWHRAEYACRSRLSSVQRRAACPT